MQVARSFRTCGCPLMKKDAQSSHSLTDGMQERAGRHSLYLPSRRLSDRPCAFSSARRFILQSQAVHIVVLSLAAGFRSQGHPGGGSSGFLQSSYVCWSMDSHCTLIDTHLPVWCVHSGDSTLSPGNIRVRLSPLCCKCGHIHGRILINLHSPIILANKAQLLRKSTGDPRYRAPFELGQRKTFRDWVDGTILKPCIMLVQEPMLIATTVYISVRGALHPGSYTRR